MTAYANAKCASCSTCHSAFRRDAMLAYISRTPLFAILLCALLFLGGCAKDIPAFAPPSERSMHNSQYPWKENTFLSLAYHDVEDTDPDQTYVSVSTEHLIEQFAWLREHGYQQIGRAHVGPPVNNAHLVCR